MALASRGTMALAEHTMSMAASRGATNFMFNARGQMEFYKMIDVPDKPPTNQDLRSQLAIERARVEDLQNEIKRLQEPWYPYVAPPLYDAPKTEPDPIDFSVRNTKPVELDDDSEHVKHREEFDMALKGQMGVVPPVERDDPYDT